MQYNNLKEFKQFHGKAFTYMLEKLETKLEEIKNERPNKNTIQLKLTPKKLHKNNGKD